jgi:hypothetical protein
MMTTGPIHNTAVARNEWCIDSGATNHLYSNQVQFSTFRMLENPIPVYMSDGKPIKATGIGIVTLRINSSNPLRLTTVLYIPDIKHNLLAVNCLDRSYKIVFNNGKCSISDKHGRTVMEDHSFKGLYRISTPATTNIASTSTKQPTKYLIKSIPIQRWHERLGYLYTAAVK